MTNTEANRSNSFTETHTKIGKHLATFNLFREHDNSLHVTVADAAGVRTELGDSGAPLYLCAMNALRAALREQAA